MLRCAFEVGNGKKGCQADSTQQHAGDALKVGNELECRISWISALGPSKPGAWDQSARTRLKIWRQR
jgi:hypothetical protein